MKRGRVTKTAKVNKAKALVRKARAALAKAEGRPLSTRDPHDAYMTPDDAAERLVRLTKRVWDCRVYRGLGVGVVQAMRALEPTAGDGAICKALKLSFNEFELTACELQEKFTEPLRASAPLGHIRIEPFEAFAAGCIAQGIKFDVACANLPFKHIDTHLPLLLQLMQPWGVVGLLAQCNVLHGQDRSEDFWRRTIRMGGVDGRTQHIPPPDALPALRIYAPNAARINFRGSRNAQRDYSFYIFDGWWEHAPLVMNHFDF